MSYERDIAGSYRARAEEIRTVAEMDRNACEYDRGCSALQAKWPFTTPGAGIKLEHLHPSIRVNTATRRCGTDWEECHGCWHVD